VIGELTLARLCAPSGERRAAGRCKYNSQAAPRQVEYALDGDAQGK